MKKSKLLLSSVVMMLVSVLALTTSAYAWFVSNATPNVSRITASVTESNSLTISGTETGTYGQVLPLTGITWAAFDPTNTADITNKMSPVTLDDGPATPAAGVLPALTQLPFRFMSTADNAYDGFVNDGDGKTIPTAGADLAADLHKNWIQFDVWFRASSSLDVYLDVGARINTTTTANKTNFGTSETNVDRQEIIETLRMAITFGTYAAAGYGTTNTTPTTLIVYEPNDTNVILGTHTTDGFIDTLRYPTLAGANYYKQSVVSANTLKTNDTEPVDLKFSGIPLFRIDPLTTGDAAMLVRATFYIWIEGNDLDCTDAAAASSFFADIFFQGVPHTGKNPGFTV